jgi:NADH:ubiquinone oxidoreductase subunit 5 (subunit L)/multisubunit Na+/H+ antiporter MnhA subunit
MSGISSIGTEIFWLVPLFPLAVFVILAVGIPVAGKITSFVSDGVRREELANEVEGSLWREGRAMASIAPTLSPEELANEVEGRGDARHRPENPALSVPHRPHTLAGNPAPSVPRQPYLSAGIAIAAMTCASIVSILGLIDAAQGKRVVVGLPWLAVGSYRLVFALWLDPLSAVVATLVSVVGLIVFIYAASYMADDQRRGRFFAEFSLFTGSMLALVLAADLITLFIAWELVGLCSYLLIGFWFERPGAPQAASKAFFITRLADLAFLAGVLLLIGTIGTGNISTILRVSSAGHIPYGLLLAIALLLFAGAAGKSAQVPFQGWLPDAMLGPTPVSALLHSATMVAAGVFLVARLYPLFQAANPSLIIVAWVGVITSLLGGAAALVDTDLKRTLAYSTMSQIGLMFVGLGAGSLIACVLLLIAQAFYKATLFLAAEAVDRVVEGTAFERMGGLAKRMPLTAIAFAIAAAALAGLPVTIALPPKDPVLATAWQANSALYIAALLASILTALYSAFLSVGPKAAGLAVLTRTLLVAYPHNLGSWAEILALLAAITMTVGNVFALRQTSVKRLLAYSSIGQVGYMLVGIAAAERSALALPGLLLYLTVYLFMNLGAFLAVDALERQTKSDDISQFSGLGRRLPLTALVLAICLLALAGFPPFGSFVGKVMLFSAAIGAGWTWLAVVMVINITISLFYYVRVLEPMYLRPSNEKPLQPEPIALRFVLIILAIGTLVSGIFPQEWVVFVTHAASLLGMH